MKLTEKSKLTGKASLNFLIKNGHIGHLQESIQNSLIVDWFDSVGIYIFPCHNFGWGFEIFQDGDDKVSKIGCDYNSRNEAINEAIIKANKIFNQNNKG